MVALVWPMVSLVAIADRHWRWLDIRSARASSGAPADEIAVDDARDERFGRWRDGSRGSMR